MATVKRERSINWEKEEKTLLREIIRPYIHIIENKDISTNTNKSKLKTWIEITEKFNRANKRIRDKKQLMNQWKVTKLQSKKEVSLYRQQTAQTGGGPKPPSPDPETLEVLEMIPQEFEIDFNEFDCDGVKDMSKDIKIDSKINKNVDVPIIEDNHKQQPTTSSEPVIIITDELSSNGQLTPSTSQSVFTKKPITYQMTPNYSAKKRVLTEKFDFGKASLEDMHKFRLLENERQQKEHESRLKNMAEMHNQVMVNLKLQEDLLRKMLENMNK